MRDPIYWLPGVDRNISPQLLSLLNQFQQKINSQIIITSGYRAGDSAEHGKGQAVDIIAPDYEERLLDLYMTAERFNFGGIGVYPDWFFNKKVYGGLHLDIRPTGMGARWIGVKVNGQNQYLSLNQEVLKKYGVI